MNNRGKGWTTVAFGDVVKLNKERVQDPLSEGLDRYVGLEHLEPGDLKIRRWGDVADGTTFTNVFRPDQVLFAKRRAYQRKVAVADFSGVCSGDIYVLTPKNDRLLRELLPFICQTDSFFDYAIGTSAGSLSPRTNWTSLASYEFALPPLVEQHRIVSVIRAAEDAGQVIRKAEGHLLGIAMAHLSSIELDSSFEFSQLGDILTGIEAGQSLPASDVSPGNGEFGVLKVSAVDQWRFRPDEAKVLLDPMGFDPTRQVRSGDLLMTRANTSDLVAKACLVEDDYLNLMLSDKTWRLLPHADFDSTILWYLLQAPGVRRQVKAAATGSGAAMKNISQAKLRRIAISRPKAPRTVNQVLLVAQGLRRGMKMVAERRYQSAQLRGRILNRLLTGGPE